MEWSRIKSILICVFAAANIFLFVVYISINSSPAVSEEAVENTVSILKANGVELDPALISRSIDQKKVCNVENLFENTEELAAYAWSMAQQQQRDYFNPARTRVQDGAFSYKAENPQAAGEISDAVKYAKAELSSLGLLPKQYQTRTAEDGAHTTVTFYLAFDGKPIFDIFLDVVVTPAGITELQGQNWLADQLSESGMADAQSMAELLITFASDAALDRPEQTRITSIDEGYYVGTRTEKLKTTVVPALKIMLSDGSAYYYDARNGVLLQYET